MSDSIRVTTDILGKAAAHMRRNFNEIKDIECIGSCAKFSFRNKTFVIEEINTLQYFVQLYVDEVSYYCNFKMTQLGYKTEYHDDVHDLHRRLCAETANNSIDEVLGPDFFETITKG